MRQVDSLSQIAAASRLKSSIPLSQVAQMHFQFRKFIKMPSKNFLLHLCADDRNIEQPVSALGSKTKPCTKFFRFEAHLASLYILKSRECDTNDVSQSALKYVISEQVSSAVSSVQVK